MPDHYYSYEKNGWHFIVLDATDYAYYSNPLHDRTSKKLNKYFDSTIGKPNHRTYNAAIGDKQQRWLKKQLKRAESSQKYVIVFSHSPLRPPNSAENLWNNDAIVDILESSPNVVAYINGHNHAGNYESSKGYITSLCV